MQSVSVQAGFFAEVVHQRDGELVARVHVKSRSGCRSVVGHCPTCGGTVWNHGFGCGKCDVQLAVLGCQVFRELITDG